jgi:5'-3' exonuclease
MGVADLLAKVFGRFVQKRTCVKAIVHQGFTRGVVDTSAWLHKAMKTTDVAVAIFEKGRVRAMKGITDYFACRLDMLEKNGMTSVHFVRDGSALPAKSMTNIEREQARSANARLATTLRGKDAKAYAKACVAATGREDWIEQELCDWLDEYAGMPLRDMVVSWEVAPFESDAQIAHLCELNRFDFAIGEDQDFFIFGVSRTALQAQLH